MEYYIIAFRSRSDTLAFYEFLKGNGVFVSVVTTPKEAGVGCGLSVKTDKSFAPFINNALRLFRRKSYAGVFVVSERNGKRTIKAV